MNASDIKPEQTYWQSLKIVTGGLICGLFKAEMWGSYEIVDALGTLAWVVFLLVTRLVLLVSLPISAPVVTWLVVRARRQYKRYLTTG